MTSFGPWTPYSQDTSTMFGSIYLTDGRRINRAVQLRGTTFFYTPNDDIARSCAKSHITVGSSVVTDWPEIGAACPTVVPDPTTSQSDWFDSAEATVQQTIQGSEIFDYNLFGQQTRCTFSADTTLTVNGIPSWTDPTIAPPPDTSPDGRISYEYAPFTALTVTLTPTDPDPFSFDFADYGGTVKVYKEALTSPTGWAPNPAGTVVSTILCGLGAAPDPVTLDLTAGPVKLRWSLDIAELGVLPGPYPWPFGSLSSGSGCRISYRVTPIRTGLRRASGPGIPLHQRQRTDGLGGGPPHASTSQTSRQLTVFQRGQL